MKPKSSSHIWTKVRSCTLSVSLIVGLASWAQAQDVVPTVSTLSSPNDSVGSHGTSIPEIMAQAFQDLSKNNQDAALQDVDKVIELDSRNQPAHLLRAGIYGQQKRWEEANYEYQIILTAEPENATARFDVADLNFLQKKFDDARSGFASLTNDKDLGDLATYKVFLCDLLGGHGNIAASDLQALDQVGCNPSYYFGNVAWDIAHNKNEDAASWLKSAAYIYENSPDKFRKYAASLTSVGYLPLKLSSAP